MTLHWHDRLAEATEVASRERKPLLIDFSLPG